MWVEFIVGSLYSEKFVSGYSGFPLSSKTNISKFNWHNRHDDALDTPKIKESLLRSFIRANREHK